MRELHRFKAGLRTYLEIMDRKPETWLPTILAWAAAKPNISTAMSAPRAMISDKAAAITRCSFSNTSKKIPRTETGKGTGKGTQVGRQANNNSYLRQACLRRSPLLR